MCGLCGSAGWLCSVKQPKLSMSLTVCTQVSAELPRWRRSLARFRFRVRKVVEHKYFSHFFLVCILLNTGEARRIQQCCVFVQCCVFSTVLRVSNSAVCFGICPVAILLVAAAIMLASTVATLVAATLLLVAAVSACRTWPPLIIGKSAYLR